MRFYVPGYRGYTFSKAKRFSESPTSTNKKGWKPKPRAKTKRRMARISNATGESKSQNNRTRPDKTSSELPRDPEDDKFGDYLWEIVDIKCGNNPSEGFSLTGKSHKIGDHMMWARKQNNRTRLDRKSSELPSDPEADKFGDFLWHIVDIQCGMNPSEGFSLTGKSYKIGVHMMWARKLLSSNPQ